MSEISRFLEWDTDFFGVRIGQVVGDTLDECSVARVVDWCSSERIDCLYFMASADSYDTTRLAERNGFELMDFRIAFGLSTKKRPSLECGSSIRPATEYDSAAAAAIAREVHKGGRFHFDPRLAHRADEFYGVWITNSISGFADAVFVCDVEQRVAGYVTCKVNADGTGQIGLIGVDSGRQGLGIGRCLVAAAVDWFVLRGCPEVLVVTQGRNIPAQILYQKCGFVTRSVHYWYHRWGAASE